MKLAAVILAGGKSTRLCGLAKGNINIKHDTSIISQLITELQTIGIFDIAISTNIPELFAQYNKPLIADTHENIGPLAGIISGLKQFQTSADGVLFIPCDLPNITANELQRLRSALKSDDAVYATTSSRDHPLCAGLKASCYKPLLQVVSTGTHKVIDAWNQLHAQPCKFAIEERFININSFQDLEKLHRAKIWLVSGACKGVGKTKLALKLCEVLPNSYYAKYGHGKYNPAKNQNFFTDLDRFNSFITTHICLSEHLIIEANQSNLATAADIKIFIPSANKNATQRTDCAELASAADIRLQPSQNVSLWVQQILENLLL